MTYTATFTPSDPAVPAWSEDVTIDDSTAKKRAAGERTALAAHDGFEGTVELKVKP